MFTQEETLAILKLLVEAHVNDAVYKPEYERVKAQVEAQEQLPGVGAALGGR